MANFDVRCSTLLFLFGTMMTFCSPDQMSKTRNDGVSIQEEGPLFIALGKGANGPRSNQFLVLAHAPDRTIDSKGVRFCLGNKSECLAGSKLTIRGQPTENNGFRFFVSENPIEISNDLVMTILATDQNGADLSGTFVFKENSSLPSAASPQISTQPGTSVTSDPSQSNITSDRNMYDGSASRCYKAPSSFVCDVELEITNLINQRRQSVGVPSVAYDSRIAFISRKWSAEQARTGMISKTWFNEGTWLRVYREEFGEGVNILAENVAEANTEENKYQIAASVMDRWLLSDESKSRILDRNVNAVGIGYAPGQDGVRFITADFGIR